MCVCVFFSFFISWLCFLPWTKVSFFCTPSPLVYSSITLLFILPSLSLFLLLYLCLCIVSAQKYQHHPFTLPMTLKTIYIARHGYRSNWLPLPEQIPPPTGIDSDPPLAPHGVKQAQELAGFITKDLPQKNLPVPQMIFSSPFYRCIETINPTAEALHLPIQLERGLGEWFKPHRKIVPVPADHLTLHKFFNTVPSEMDWLWDTVIPSLEGETEEEIFKRCQVFWSKFIPKFESIYPNVECIILVTHAATKIALGMALAGYSNVRDFLTEKDGGDGKTTRIGGSTCSLDGYAKSSNGDTWNLFMNAETSFLSCGAEMDWHFATSQFEAGSKEDIEYRKKLQVEQDKANLLHARQRKL